MRENLVDYRALGNEREDPHGATTGRTGERVHFVDAPQELGPPPPRLAERQRLALGDLDRCGLDVGGGRLATDAAWPIGVPPVIARHHLVLVRDVRHEAREELQRIDGLCARRRPVAFVGAILHRRGGAVILQALERHGIPCTIPREPLREIQVAVGQPHAIVRVKPRVRPREHALGLVGVEEAAPHEQPEHGAPKRFGEGRRVVRGPGDERTIGAKAAVGHHHMHVRVPIRQRAVRLDARNDADREIGLARERAHGSCDGPSRNAREVAEECAAVQTPGAEPLRNGEHHLAVRHGREERLLQPKRPQREALGVATEAEVAGLAREREQVLVRAGVTAHTRKAMLEDAAREDLSATSGTTGRHAPYVGAKRSSYPVCSVRK